LLAASSAHGVAFELAPRCALHDAPMCARKCAFDAGLALQRGLCHFLRSRRGKASSLLKGLRYILPPLLNEFVAPVLELLGDDFNAAGVSMATTPIRPALWSPGLVSDICMTE